MVNYPCPVVTSIAGYVAEESRAELAQLAREFELDLLLADPQTIGTMLLERIGDLSTPESVRVCLAKLLGRAVQAAHDGKPLAEIDRNHPVFCGWALAQVDQCVAENLKEAA